MIERIRRRLTLGYVGILALILVLFGAIVVTSFSHQLTRQQDARLVQNAEDAAGFVRSHAPGSPEGVDQQPPSTGDGLPEGARLEDLARIRQEDGRADIAVFVVPPGTSSGGANAGDGDLYGRVPDPNSASTSDLGLPATEAAREAEREGRPQFETIDGPEGEVRVASLPVSGGSGETIAVVQAAQPRRVAEEPVNALLLVLVPVGLGSLLLAGIGGLFMSRRAMRPVVDSFRRQRAFVADASHELKTPLALVKIGAEMVQRDPTDPENREVVEDQLSEIDRMDALLSDLLVLARLDAGKLDVESKPFDLSVVAAETAGRFLKRAASEGVRLEVEVPDRLPARGDPGKTGQILTALLDNAVRYTPEGGTITVSGRRLDDRAEAGVRDTGPGIPPEHLDRIFDRFYRVEEARTRAGGGTGLGLSIARDLARAQGGELVAENAKGGGAAFRLRLPGR